MQRKIISVTLLLRTKQLPVPHYKIKMIKIIQNLSFISQVRSSKKNLMMIDPQLFHPIHLITHLLLDQLANSMNLILNHQLIIIQKFSREESLLKIKIYII